MKEYIEREVAKEMLWCYGVTPALIDFVPAADVFPVRHGRWYLAEDSVFRCSECDRICLELDAPYCYCGALMDGKED